MERPDLEDSSPDIEVLDGQMSVEELLAELGFEWGPGTGAARLSEEATGESFSQQALF